LNIKDENKQNISEIQFDSRFNLFLHSNKCYLKLKKKQNFNIVYKKEISGTFWNVSAGLLKSSH
jgi:hypothetical protein